MTLKPLTLLSMAAAMLSPPTLLAEEIGHLFDYSTIDTTADLSFVESRSPEQYHSIDLDLNLIAEAPTQLSFEIPGMGTVWASKTHASSTARGDLQWLGEVFDAPADGSESVNRIGNIIINQISGVFTGVITTHRSSHEIYTDPSGSQYLLGRTDDESSSIFMPELPSQKLLNTPDSQTVLSTNYSDLLPEPQNKMQSTAVIDVLFVYDRELASTTNELRNTLNGIHGTLATANALFINSGMNARYQIADIVPYSLPNPYLDPRTIRTSIANDSFVLSQRNATGADMVVMMVPYSSGDTICGAATVPYIDNAGNVKVSGVQSQPVDFTDQAFVAYRSGCGVQDFTLAHELGHTLGMQHAEDEPTVENPLQQYAYGYDREDTLIINDRRASTVMACNNEPGATPPASNFCRRIPYYSDPNQQLCSINIDRKGCVLTALGTSMANNRLFGSQRLPLYSQFRPTQGSYDSPPQILFNTVIDQLDQVYSQKVITFNIDAVDREDGINLTYRWTIDRPTGNNVIRNGKQISYRFTQIGPHTLTVRVTDRDGNSTEQQWSMNIIGANTPPDRGFYQVLEPQANEQNHYFSLFRNGANQYVMGLFIHDAAGRPIWYNSGVVAVNNGVFSSHQLLHVNKFGNNHNITDVGSVALLWTTRSQGTLYYTINGQQHQKTVHLTQPRSGFGGQFYAPTDSGWGITMTTSSNGRLFSIMPIYDGSSPRWVIGAPTLASRYALNYVTANGNVSRVGSFGLSTSGPLKLEGAFVDFLSGNEWRPGVFNPTLVNLAY